MPLAFEFKADPRAPDVVTFKCPLVCGRCTHTTRGDARCKNRACIGVPLCWQHLRSARHLRVQASTIPGAGKGVFVMKPKAPAGEPVFRAGDLVTGYEGELVTKAETRRRYGANGAISTAPYTASVDRRYDEDASCRRGVGALVNHKPQQENVQLFVNGPAGSRSQRVELYATRDIFNGQELFLDYGAGYTMPRQLPGRPDYQQYSTLQRRHV